MLNANSNLFVKLISDLISWNIKAHEVKRSYLNLNRNFIGLGNLHFLLNRHFDVLNFCHSFYMMLMVNVVRCVDFEEFTVKLGRELLSCANS